MKSPIELSAENFEGANPRVHLAPDEAEQPAPETQVHDAASTLVGSSEVRRRDERNVFDDILEGIV